MDWPEFLTETQVAEYLGLKGHEDHIRNLRRRQGLPHIRFWINKAEVVTYPRDLVRKWAEARVLKGSRRAREEVA